MGYIYNKEKKIAYLYFGMVKILEIFFKIYKKRQNNFPVEIKKILIIKPDHIGDTIISTICLKSLKENYPNSKIDILCGSWGKKTYEYQNKINKIYILDHIFLNRSNINIIKKIMIFIKQYLKNIFLLRKEKYDLCILLRAPLKGNLISLAGFIKSKYIIGYEGMSCENILDAKSEYSLYIPEKDNFFNLLKKIPNFKLKSKTYNYELHYIADNLLKEKIEKLNINKNKFNICFNTEGNDENRKLTLEKIIEICKKIQDEEVDIYIINTINNRIKMEKLKKELKNIKILFETLEIYEIGDVLKNMNLLITVDTAITHLGSIFLENIIVLYEKDEIKFPRFSPNVANGYHIISKNKNINYINGEELVEIVKIIKKNNENEV